MTLTSWLNVDVDAWLPCRSILLRQIQAANQKVHANNLWKVLTWQHQNMIIAEVGRRILLTSRHFHLEGVTKQLHHI